VPPPPTLEELLDFYDKNWLPQGYQSAEEEENYKAYGRQILAKFWGIHTDDFRVPLAVERMFHIDISGVKLMGFIDRVDKLESGGLSIVDYKSSLGLFTKDDLKNSLQLTLYQLAAEETWQLPVERLTLYHLRSNTPCSCTPRGEAELKEARELVLEVASNIAEGSFPATENEGCPCDFAEHCPYYKHLYLETEAAKTDILRGLTVEEAVEQHVSLQRQIKELELKLSEIKEMIIAFCQAEGLNRVYGTEHALTYKMVERTGFDEEKVRALLEPEGLWGQVLEFSPSRLRELITDETIAKEIRQKLEDLRGVISSSPQLWARKLTKEE